MATPTDPLADCVAASDRVLKKQKLCTSLTASALDAALAAVEAARADAARGDAGALRTAADALSAADTAASLAAATKELHGAVGRLGKALDGAFVPDPCAAARSRGPCDAAALDAATADYLAASGRHTAARALADESGVRDGDALVAPFAEAAAVLASLARRDVAPADAWVAARRDALVTASGEAAVIDLEFALARARFVAAASGGPSAALGVARAAFPAFASTHLPDVTTLMGALAFIGRSRTGDDPLAGLPSRYRDAIAPAWSAAATCVRAAAAALAGQPPRPPLLVALAAGAAALPTLLKLAAKAGAGGAGAAAAAAAAAAGGDEVPVDLSLGPEFAFRSTFSCPVSREVATASNPPLLLPCGHVICRESAASLARAPGRAFKCPYCPADASLASARVLHFPSPSATASGR